MILINLKFYFIILYLYKSHPDNHNGIYTLVTSLKHVADKNKTFAFTLKTLSTL